MPEEGKDLDGLLSGTLDLTLHKRVGIRKPRLKAMPLLAHPHLDSKLKRVYMGVDLICCVFWGTRARCRTVGRLDIRWKA